MKVLGISSNYHDSSAALVVDGQVIAAAAEERFSLQKHDPSFPELATRFCLERAGLKAEEIDLVCYHEDPSVKFTRTLASSFVRYPFSFPTFAKSMRDAVTSGFWVKGQISNSLGVHPSRVFCVPHHCSHAAHAFFTAAHENAAVLTIDAAGEWLSGALFRGDRGEMSLEPLAISPFPHSLGLVYSAFTGYLGFKVNDGECSTMALAAFGKPVYADAIRRVIHDSGDGGFAVDGSYFDFTRDDSLPLRKRFLEIFGAARAPGAGYSFDCLRDDFSPVSKEEQRLADVAASLQLVTEETVLRLAEQARRLTGLDRLCLAGGVSLNCVAVGKLIESGIFRDVHVPPDPGDGGAALGAALFGSAVRGGRAGGAFQPYLGKQYEPGPTVDMLPHLRSHRRVKVLVRGDLPAVVEKTAASLAEGKIVGWVQGRFEAGPRALGARSILADPSRVDVARRLSDSVKKRASFRPYACSVADFERDRLFEGTAAHTAPARWMQASCRVKPEARASLRAAMHVDGTTRPHVCDEATRPEYYALLRAFGERTGTAALLNTSFNESGMPIVASPELALLSFLRTDMDMLAIGDCLITKEV